jgi:predicted CopG family antitoxin
MAKSQSYHLKIPNDAYEALHTIAKAERRLLADVIREALENYTKSKGLEISFEVERGGYRPRKSDGDDQPAE